MKARIVKIEPLAMFEGNVYTQNVVIKLLNDKELTLFDPNLLCKREYINKTKEIEIVSLFIPEKTSINTIGVTDSGEICGIIKNIENNQLIIDFGVGEIRYNLTMDEKESFKKGESVLIKGRIDLKKIS